MNSRRNGGSGPTELTYGIDLPETNRQTAPDDAAQVILDTVNASPAPVTIVVVGPLTNSALVLDLDPTLAGRIDMLYVMGGAVGVEGNVGKFGSRDRK